ncbi:MAG: hypothetical protein WKF75_00215, partial [Singulisphaera sp.]
RGPGHGLRDPDRPGVRPGSCPGVDALTGGRVIACGPRIASVGESGDAAVTGERNREHAALEIRVVAPDCPVCLHV